MPENKIFVYLASLQADWTVWPAAQAFNFFVLPPQFRVVYVSAVTFCWNTFLSYMKHKVCLLEVASSKCTSPCGLVQGCFCRIDSA